ncbi:MAG TPA: hypothetical protein VKK81_09040 [Candidatus Binatia bacterium]|nr:hypothetical protein [Candidatus Binatia bacterium]
MTKSHYTISLLQEAEEEILRVPPSQSLGHAVRTIIVADFIMSLDNTLAVAGVGRGHPGLIIVGLLFSIYVIMTSSLFIAALMNRYPFLVILGAGVLS